MQQSLSKKNRIVIRAFKNSDEISPITELLHGAYAQLSALGFKYHSSHQSDEATLQQLRSGWSFFAEVDGEVVATVTLRPPMKQVNCEWYRKNGVFSFGQLAVRPDWQRQGIGLSLLRHIEREALGMGAVELALDPPAEAEHLRKWFSRQNYRFIEYALWETSNYRSAILSKNLARSSAPPTHGRPLTRWTRIDCVIKSKSSKRGLKSSSRMKKVQ